MRTLIIFALYACAYGFGRSFVLVCNQFADMVLHKIFFCSIILLSVIVCPAMAPTHDSVTESHSPTEAEECADIYNSMHLEGVVNFKAFRIAYAGYNKIINRNKDILTLIDFSKPSTEKRLFVFDMKKKQLMFSSLVSHGRNSGDNYATSFSNEYGSYKSSLGFYLTETTYNGKNGYSLILNGLEKGINDRAKERAIVVHGASYANPSVISCGGRLGRSLGCPALPQKVAKPIIDAIKGGSVMYIFAEKPEYLAKSTIVGDIALPSESSGYNNKTENKF